MVQQILMHPKVHQIDFEVHIACMAIKATGGETSNRGSVSRKRECGQRGTVGVSFIPHHTNNTTCLDWLLTDYAHRDFGKDTVIVLLVYF